MKTVVAVVDRADCGSSDSNGSCGGCREINALLAIAMIVLHRRSKSDIEAWG